MKTESLGERQNSILERFLIQQLQLYGISSVGTMKFGFSKLSKSLIIDILLNCKVLQRLQKFQGILFQRILSRPINMIVKQILSEFLKNY